MISRRIQRSRCYTAALWPLALSVGCGNTSPGGPSGATDNNGGMTASGGVSGAGVSGGQTTTGGDGTAEGGNPASGGATDGLAGTAGSAVGGGGGGASAAGAAGSSGMGGAAATGDPVAALDDRKRAFIALEFGIWHHFGILTYTGKWAQGNLPINDFNPGSTLNPEQWAQAAKSAGAKFGVLPHATTMGSRSGRARPVTST